MKDIQTPPFLLTYWNPFNEKAPGIGQSFLNYVKDVSLANYTANVTGGVVGAYIENASRDQIKTLQHGFEFLDQSMARIQQEQINTNILLENISELLKLPDSEKQRQLHIERGVKFSNQALIDEDLAIDAKNELDAALQLMSQDWFVLQQLGILLLYSEKVLDIPEAKELFLKAAKYATAESKTIENSYINNLFKQKLSSPFQNGNNTSQGLADFVREAFLSAALASYILSEFDEAVVSAKKALSVNPEDAKSLFLTAKYLSRNDRKEEAFELLKKAIEKAPYLSIATYGDKDLITIPSVLDFCHEATADFFRSFDLIKSRSSKIKDFISNSIVFKLIDDLKNEDDIIKCLEILEQPLNYNLGFSGSINFPERDPLFGDAATLIITSQSASISLLQSRMKLGENRAKRLINQLEAAGIVGKQFENQDGEVLVKSKSALTLLEGYFVKDLHLKWEEINKKCEEDKIRKMEEEVRNAKVEENVPGIIQNDKNSPACFIATATLGNKNHPIIIDLRHFRDSSLIRTNWGRKFTKWYYKNGPKIAKLISKSSIFRIVVLWTLIKPLHFIIKRIE